MEESSATNFDELYSRIKAERPISLDFSQEPKKPEPTLDEARDDLAKSVSEIAHALFAKRFGPLVGSVTQTTVNAADLSPEKIAEFQKAQGQLSGAIGRLLVSVERYPELKATEAFRDLQAQLEGTENRIKVSRNDFNSAVQDYNTSVKKFPMVLFSGLFGFTEKGYFTAEAGSEKAPTVDFKK